MSCVAGEWPASESERMANPRIRTGGFLGFGAGILGFRNPRIRCNRSSASADCRSELMHPEERVYTITSIGNDDGFIYCLYIPTLILSRESCKLNDKLTTNPMCKERRPQSFSRSNPTHRINRQQRSKELPQSRPSITLIHQHFHRSHLAYMFNTPR